MGLPSMNITFSEKAADSAKKSARGTIGMIVKETIAGKNPVTIHKASEIPEALSADTKAQVTLALKGHISTPTKVVVYGVGADAANYTKGLEYFTIHRVNWLVCPTVATDKQTEAVSTWVKEQRDVRNKVKAVLPEVVGDNEGIVNYATKTANIRETAYTAEKFCARIAGILAGTPIKMGATFAILDDVTDCEKKTRTELNTAIDTGKLCLYYDGEKVKIAKAVNSLTTVPKGKSSSWKSIAVVEVMDMIYNDLIMLAEENYIGKYRNTFDNKCLLLSAINSYLAEVNRMGAIENYEIKFDVAKIREYLVNAKGMKQEEVDAMKDGEVQKQYTDDKVFLTARMTLIDIMEEITLEISV